MQIQVGHILKSPNAMDTSRFSVSQTIDSVRLKDATSVQNPVFVVNQTITGTENNYLRVTNPRTWGYYWIIDIVHVTTDVCEIHCKRDFLATFSSNILLSKGWWKYGGESVWNKYLDDDRFGPQEEYACTKEDGGASGGVAKVNTPFTSTDNGAGYYVVKIQATGGNSGFTPSSYTGVITYLMDGSALGQLYNNLMAALNLAVPTGTPYDETFIQNTLGINAFDISSQIKQILWVPFDLSTAVTCLNYSSGSCVTENSISIGPFEISIPSGSIRRVINPHCVDFEQNFTIPMPSNSLPSDLPWLKASKYMKVTLTHPGGAMDISSDTFVQDANPVINLKESINFITGEWAFQAFLVNDASQGQLIPCGSSSGNLSSDYTGALTLTQHTAASASDADGKYKGLGVAGSNAGFQSGVKSVASGAAAGAVAGSFLGPVGTAVGAVIGGVVGAVKSGKRNTEKATQRSPRAGSADVIGSCGFRTCYSKTHPFSIIVEWWKPSFITDLQTYKDYCHFYGYPCECWGQADTVLGTDYYLEAIQCDMYTQGTYINFCYPTVEEISAINDMLVDGIRTN